MLIFFFSRRVTRILKKRRWRKRVKLELENIVKRYQKNGQTSALAVDLSNYIRRLSRLTQPSAATLYGDDWLRYLDRYLGGEEFLNGVGRILLEAPYQAQPHFEAQVLIDLIRRWSAALLAKEQYRV